MLLSLCTRAKIGTRVLSYGSPLPSFLALLYSLSSLGFLTLVQPTLDHLPIPYSVLADDLRRQHSWRQSDKITPQGILSTIRVWQKSSRNPKLHLFILVGPAGAAQVCKNELTGRQRSSIYLQPRTCPLLFLGTAIFQLHNTTSIPTGDASSNRPRFLILGEEPSGDT